MDRDRYSTIAHRDHVFCSPLFPKTVDALVERLALPRGARVVDVGCGKAEMLIRVIERYGATGVGIDPNPAFLDEARRHAAGRIVAGELILHPSTMAEASIVSGSFDAALCIGATHAFGGHAAALRGLSALVRPRGVIVVGEGYWKREPARGYLDVLGGTPDEFTTHDGNLALGQALGLRSRFAITSTDAEWDSYEDMYETAVERFAAEHPDDPDRDAMLARIRPWRAAYLKWGRETLGFGVYVWEK